MIGSSPATENENASPGVASWSVRPTQTQLRANTPSRSKSGRGVALPRIGAAASSPA
jgi:hypothetical protein